MIFKTNTKSKMNNIISLSFFYIVTNTTNSSIDENALYSSYNEFAKYINDLAESDMLTINILRILNYAQIELITLQKVNRLCELGKNVDAMKNIYIEKALLLLDAERKNLLFFQSKPHTETKDTKETQKKSPRWKRTQNELVELVTSLHASEAFCDEYGNNSTLIELVKMFNGSTVDFYTRRNQILDRKRESTPFLRKLIDAYNLVIEKKIK